MSRFLSWAAGQSSSSWQASAWHRQPVFGQSWSTMSSSSAGWLASWLVGWLVCPLFIDTQTVLVTHSGLWNGKSRKYKNNYVASKRELLFSSTSYYYSQQTDQPVARLPLVIVGRSNKLFLWAISSLNKRGEGRTRGTQSPLKSVPKEGHDALELASNRIQKF